MWEIPWHVVEKMMIDAPSYKYKKDEKGRNGKGKPIPQKVSSLRSLIAQKPKN